MTKDYYGEVAVDLGWEPSDLSYIIGEKYDLKLRAVDSTIISWSDCKDKYPNSTEEENFICANHYDCKNDSGGSIVLYEKTLQRYILIGIKTHFKRYIPM